MWAGNYYLNSYLVVDRRGGWAWSSNPAEDEILSWDCCCSQLSSRPLELRGTRCPSAQSRHMSHMSYETPKPGYPPGAEIPASSSEVPTWQLTCRPCRFDARPWDGLAAFLLSNFGWKLSCQSAPLLPQHREKGRNHLLLHQRGPRLADSGHGRSSE